jgi:serine/threonine protein kinase/Tfp pilus assembly protein PilF
MIIEPSDSRLTSGREEEDLTRYPGPLGADTCPANPLSPGATPSLRSSDSGPLAVGQAFGSRYHIIRLLGMGGMGAVYQAWDRELVLGVALKVIRPEVVAADPAAALDMERRFKRELVLARQVTHTNVVRIHDLGEHDGIKYISMPYVDGEDLATRLKRTQKLPMTEALMIARQVAAGLAAAHGAGIVHRDLKPANIMIGKNEQALIMDFGIARSAAAFGVVVPASPSSSGPPAATTIAAVAEGQTLDVTLAPAEVVATFGDAATIAPPGRNPVPTPDAVVASLQHGAVVGTLEYMAPEQARAEAVDQRADIYAFGMILSEMMVGRRIVPDGITPIEALQQRIQIPPGSLLASDANLPEALDAIVVRCLQLDPAHRFQTTTELVEAFEALDANGVPLPKVRRLTPRLMAATAALVIAMLLGTYVLTRRAVEPTKPHEPVTVLIADFQNSTNDPSLNNTLEPMLRLALEDAGFISAHDRNRIRASFGMQPPETLDEAAARQVALKQALGIVLSGSIDRKPAGYEISVKAVRPVTGNVVVSTKRSASSKEQILGAVTLLATTVRKALGDKASESDQLFAMKSISTTSLEVVGHYARGTELQSKGKYEEARQSFLEALTLDPKFGLGYQSVAAMSRNVGKIQDAEKYAKEALRYVVGMTERERLSTRGFYYRMTGDLQHCVKEYTQLIERFSADTFAHNQRAICLSKLRRMREAMDDMRQALQILPNHVTYRTNLAFFMNFAGEFREAEREVRAMKDPVDRGMIALAFSQLGQGLLGEAAKTYEKIGAKDADGAQFAASALGDLALYEGRFSEATRILERGADADLALKDVDNAANKLVSLAYVHLMRGRKDAAAAAANKSLENSQAMPSRFLAARILGEAGATSTAGKLAGELASQVAAEPQAYGKIIQGVIALNNGETPQAIKILTDANALLDTWLGHFDLGRAYLKAGAFTQADSEFDICVKRRGETLSLIDPNVTYGYFPPVYYYQGRAREGSQTEGFAASYREYLNIRGKSIDDPLLREVRERANHK